MDQAFIPAVRSAIQANELGPASPYCLSYACLGNSGASFGIFQGDTNVNARARDTLDNVLRAANVDDDARVRILDAVSRPCPGGNPLSPDDTKRVNDALACSQGRDLVDQMDDGLMRGVLGYIDSSVDAAGRAGKTIDPEAQLYIALWVNMTGAPDTLNRWLGGGTEMGMAPPDGPIVTVEDIKGYLQASKYFQENPRNFAHMEQSVAAGAKLLPRA